MVLLQFGGDSVGGLLDTEWCLPLSQGYFSMGASNLGRERRGGGNIGRKGGGREERMEEGEGGKRGREEREERGRGEWEAN